MCFLIIFIVIRIIIKCNKIIKANFIKATIHYSNFIKTIEIGLVLLLIYIPFCLYLLKNF